MKVIKPPFCPFCGARLAEWDHDDNCPVKGSVPLTLEIDTSGSGIVWRVMVGNVLIWAHAAIEGPWESAEDLLRAIWPEEMADPFAHRSTDPPSPETLQRLAMRPRSTPSVIPPPGGAIPISPEIPEGWTEIAMLPKPKYVVVEQEDGWHAYSHDDHGAFT